jgi:hypothetical protein
MSQNTPHKAYLHKANAVDAGDVADSEDARVRRRKVYLCLFSSVSGARSSPSSTSDIGDADCCMRRSELE